MCCSHNITLCSLRYVDVRAIELEPQHNGKVQIPQKSMEIMKHILEMFPSNCSLACQHPHHHTLVDSTNSCYSILLHLLLHYLLLLQLLLHLQRMSTFGLRPLQFHIHSHCLTRITIRFLCKCGKFGSILNIKY